MNMTTGLDSLAEPELMLDINTTPLIDVMLVLLIMLIITIPLQLHAIDFELPVESTVEQSQTRSISIEVDASSVVSVNGAQFAGRAALEKRFQEIFSQGEVQPAVQIHAHPRASYEAVALVLASAQRQGLGKLSFTGLETYERL